MTTPHSTDAFLTTHTGSLPRPADLIRMMYAKEEGVPVDAAALGARIRAAVAEAVQKQVKAEMAKRVFGDPGRSRRRTPACDGPISVREPRAAETDADNLRAACDAAKAA